MSNVKILVVDDSPTMRNIIVNTVKEAGFSHVRTAENGKVALAKLRRSDFDFLLTDWIMPGMDGIDLIKTIRSDEKLKNIPVLMVTSGKLKTHIVSAIRAGVNGILTKPFSTIMLKRKIQEIIGV
ncbi:response regulator [Candidatus Omnitrophota bacterium]